MQCAARTVRYAASIRNNNMFEGAFYSDKASRIFKHLQNLNIVEPYIQQIVSLFWNTIPVVYNLRQKRLFIFKENNPL